MTHVGVRLKQGPLYLTKGRDFKWSFHFVDKDREPLDFPPGELYLELDTNPVTIWKTSIKGSVASLKVEHQESDRIPANTRWQLVFKPAGEAAGGDPVALGYVRVQK